MQKYDHKKIEKKWQKAWAKSGIYKTKESKSAGATKGASKKGVSKSRALKTSAIKSAEKPKSYVLDMFPYPSGAGLHVGHPRGYIATDAYSRFKTMNGFNVLHPMGWDAFGLPAEEFAIKNKVHPSVAVRKNIATFKEQLSILGLNYDWSREVNTTDPEYYKWTQWAFLQMHKKGLTYESHEPINWCPSCKTGLANEDLEDGKCERCGSVVEKKPIRQWVIKITDYADRILEDLDAVQYDMPELVDKKNPHRKGAPLVERKVAHAIVYDPKKDKYLIIRNKKHGWDTIIIGGIEDEEDAVTTAKREVMEETGYTDIEYKRTLGGVTKASYFTKHKGENRVAYATAVYFELKSDKRVPIGLNEDKDDEVLWISPEDFVSGKMVNSEMDIWLERLKDPNKGWPKLLLNWPESIKESQRNWIGKSEGVNFNCKIKDLDIEVQMYNSVPQTYHAETFTVIAPEHPLVYELVKNTPKEKEVMDFVERIKKKRSQNKFDIDKDMEGIFTGRYIQSFADTGRDLPIWIASYVVADYGTGIVNCSAHDERDFQFAKKYNIPLRVVMLPENKDLAESVKNLEFAYCKDSKATLIEPSKFSGRKWGEVRSDIINHIVDNKLGTKKTNYKLRDWVFSRQRYWGEPIPLIHCAKCGVVPVPEKDLPLKLPNVKSYEPTGTGESPLAGISKWVNTKCPSCKGSAKRETNTMPQWAGSCWYYLRYIDPKNKKALVDPAKEKYWQPVDMYVGGAEHATRHLIYARFWHKFLYDIGVVSTKEPFMQLKNQGLIAGPDGRKMSKRYGNVINPNDVVDLYGADTLRVYEMFMGPFDQGIAWSTDNMIGSRRFVEKVWRLGEKVSVGAKNSPAKLDSETESLLHRTIKKVGEDIESFSFNTAISSLMILTNALEKVAQGSDQKSAQIPARLEDNVNIGISREVYKTLLQLMAPFAPHMTEEIWQSMKLGVGKDEKSIHTSKWPTFDPKKLQSNVYKIAVQINSKVRAVFESDTDEESEVVKKALDIPEIIAKLEGKDPKKVIYVKGKLVNLVV